MPMFEYKCSECGTVSDFLIGVTAEDPEILCSTCGSLELSRVISPISFTIRDGSSRFPIAGQCACGAEQGSVGSCGGGGCSCSA